MHVLSSFQRTGLASNEPRRLCWRLGNLAILLTFGFFCQPLSEVSFRIFFQRRAAVPGGSALIEVGVANPRFPERKKNLLAVCIPAALQPGTGLEQICQPPGRVTLGRFSIRTDLWLVNTGISHRNRAASAGSCWQLAPPAEPFSKELTDYTSTFPGAQPPSESTRLPGLTAQLAECAPRRASRPAADTHPRAAVPRPPPSHR